MVKQYCNKILVVIMSNIAQQNFFDIIVFTTEIIVIQRLIKPHM